ncbi:MAG: hypothetical protein JWN31_1496 [Frankiales bacterium]|nr:hypothetical protein [Frankiales bacterium]
MRRSLLAVLAAAALVVGVVPAQACVGISPMVPGLPGDSVISPKLLHVGHIPTDAGGVSMRVVRVGDQTRAFVSTIDGLTIYDATNPRLPRLLGRLPIYNWENESIAVSSDGRTAILTEFTSTFYLHVIDVSNPRLPRLAGSILLAGDHTVQCADHTCGYLFGSEGNTYDIRDRSHPKLLPHAQSWGGLTKSPPGHALHQDDAGIWVADTMPLTVFALDPTPLRLKVLTHGTITQKTAYQHNNVRPRAARYVPRAAGEPLGGPLRDGELLLGEGETNFEPQCSGSNGAFSTWSMAGFERGVPMRQLHTLRPLSNRILTEDAPVNALGCSGHWFTQKDGRDGSILVAAGWYEHGTRVLSVNPRDGVITQVGYFQPRRGSTSGAFWMPGADVIWTVDYLSGIDILAFDQSPVKRPTTAAVDHSWLVRAQVDPLSQALRDLCRAGADATTRQHDAVRRLLGRSVGLRPSG